MLTLALAAVVLGERLSAIQVMGAALVIGALLAAQFGRRAGPEARDATTLPSPSGR